jgi:tellurite resistance protein TerC
LKMFLVDVLGVPLWFWLFFFVVVVALLVFDLGVLNKKDHEIGVKESLKLSAFYISMGLLFGLFVWYERGSELAFQYYTGFILEKTLSMDNIFVMSMIFAYFSIPREYQHRVLFWGILGVIVLRGIFIGLGAAIVAEFEWVLYIFAAFLIFTGVKMLFAGDDDDHSDFSENRIYKFLSRRFNLTDEIHGHAFVVKKPDPETGKMTKYFTPLFVALVIVEFTDVIFALDSIPAIFSITTDTFVIYTSNIFAILGLRAMYFLLSAMIARFEYLKYAISVLLVFIGSKIFMAHFLFPETGKFPPDLSLGITLAILTTGIVVSLKKTR